MAAADSRVYAVMDGTPNFMAHATDTVIPDHPGAVDSTPMTVAGIGLLAIGILVGLKYLGFRFSFGVGVGGGS